jgi:hypothetical protein
MFLEVFSSSFPPFAILTNSYVNPLNRIHPLSNSASRSPPSFNVPSPFLSPEIRGPKIVDFDIDRFIPPPHREIYCTIYFIKYNVKEKFGWKKIRFMVNAVRETPKAIAELQSLHPYVTLSFRDRAKTFYFGCFSEGLIP